MEPKLFDGELSIHRYSNTDTIHVELHDGTSGTRIIELEMSATNFAVALFGSALQPCKARFFGGAHIGHSIETKEEVVRLEKGGKSNLAKFEVDGWQARDGDLGNHHRALPGGYGKRYKRYKDYRVVFTRFVEPKAENAQDQ